MQRKDYLKEHLYPLIQQTGLVGERDNSLILWMVYASRKRAKPLHAICLGASGTGKTHLQDALSALVPEEDKVSGTAISENALYYAQDLDLRHKLFLVEDLDGASNILYALREMQTKQHIRKIVAQKNSKGQIRTVLLEVLGPICFTGTTTKESIYEDNANRCLLLYLDGSRAHLEAIMDAQRKESAGKNKPQQKERIRELLRDMQALYQPIAVRNPFAEYLCIPETVFKPLRTHSHYLGFIETVTFCNQFQRQRKYDPETGKAYIESTVEDIRLANALMKEVLLSKSDELSKACRQFLEKLKSQLRQRKKGSFYKSEVRQWIRINPNNLKYYLRQLSNYGHLQIIGGNRFKQGLEYELNAQDDYEKLEVLLDKVLQEALDKIPKQNVGSG